MRLARGDEAQLLDQKIQEEFHIPSQQLMEHAGLNSAKLFQNKFPDKKKKILFLVGIGHNGADSLVMLRYLYEWGYHALFVYQPMGDSTRELWHLQMQKVEELPQVQFIKIWSRKKFDFVIDGVFGLGLNKNLSSSLTDFFKSINSMKSYKIALDIPSGIDAIQGKKMGSGFKAHETWTYGVLKTGLILQEGLIYSGRISVLDIGFPEKALKKYADHQVLITRKMIQSLLPQRKIFSSKKEGGHSHLMVGSPEYLGAGVLCSLAALKVGVGYSHIYSKADYQYLAQENPDIIFHSLEKWNHERPASLVIGSGTTQDIDIQNIIFDLIQKERKNVVLDADAIRIISHAQVRKLPSTWVITPHAGELAEVLGTSRDYVEQNRLQALEKAQAKLGCVVLLKGFPTLVADGEKVYYILSGHRALAKSGTGDVLSGMISGLMAQGLSPLRASVLGAYVHGYAARMFVKNQDALSLTASELISYLGPAILRLREGAKKQKASRQK